MSHGNHEDLGGASTAAAATAEQAAQGGEPAGVRFMGKSYARPGSRLFLDRPPLLLGAGGMLHRAWTTYLNAWGIEHRNLTRRELDFTKPETIEAALGVGTGLVINCAAYTNVDAAEQDEATATAVNGTGVGRLAETCARRGVFLVHYSTDYVFNGRGERPYLPGDPREPLSAYGRSKAVGEELIAASGCRHLILRTSWLYAPWGRNFVRTIAALVRQNKPLKIVNDQRGRPTSSEHLALASVGLVEAGAEGIYHVADGGECTWFDFACEIGRLVRPGTLIEPCATAELNRPAPRPAYSVMDLGATEKLIGPRPDWRQTLTDVVARME